MFSVFIFPAMYVVLPFHQIIPMKSASTLLIVVHQAVLACLLISGLTDTRTDDLQGRQMITKYGTVVITEDEVLVTGFTWEGGSAEEPGLPALWKAAIIWAKERMSEEIVTQK